MHLDLTVRGPTGRRDLRVTAPAGTLAGTVLDALAATVGARAGVPVWCGARLVERAVPWVAAGVRPGAELAVGDRPPVAPRRGTLALHVVGGPAAGRVVALGRGRFVVGRDATCDVALPDDAVSRRHAEVVVGPSGASVRDLGSTNGTFVGAQRCRGDVAVGAGSRVRVGGTVLVLAAPGDAMPDRPVTGPAPVLVRPEARAARLRCVAWLAPLVLGAVVAWATRSLLFLLFAAMSALLLLAGPSGGPSRSRGAARRARARFDAQVAAALAAEVVQRRARDPDPVFVGALAAAPGRRLPEHHSEEPEVLRVRLGVADLPSWAVIRDGTVESPAGVLESVPLCVDLRAGPLGVVGAAAPARALARWLVVQLAVLHPPADLELVLLLTPATSAHWVWARWLPHLRDRDRVARSPGERRAAVATIEAGGARVVLVVVDGPAPELGPAGRRVALLCVSHREAPAGCAAVARIGGDTGAQVSLAGPTGRIDAVADHVSVEWAEQVARGLAARHADDGAGIVPPSCDLLELLDLSPATPVAVAAAWARSTGRAETVLGAGAHGPLVVDLDADGPHALVAGTTGSGKSRLLQILTVGLAAAHPPEEITFLLVDYKGGAAFADCVRLPHTTGVVTDLDPQLTRRALASLDAELRRRERLLAAAGAADLAAYRARSTGESLARLVIVVDEFATLADELPAFVRGLVSVAQRGRSLGVHLLLATQRPGTAVTADIRANTSLRIALRVTGDAESLDILDAPHAAGIARTTPGRAFVRRGAELAEFHTAQVGLGTRRDVEVIALDEWRRPSVPAAQRNEHDTGLASLVDAVAGAALLTGRPAARRPWCPPLPAVLEPADVPGGRGAGLAVGLVDRPGEQAQPPLPVAASTVVVGAGGSGRTTALAAVALVAARDVSPAQLTVHVVDAADGALTDALAGLPHLGSCLGSADGELTTELLRRLAAGSPPAVLLLDGLDSLLAEDDTGGLAAALEHLLRTSTASRLTVVAAGGRTLLGARPAAGFADRWLLRLADHADYALAGVPSRAVPSGLPPGRGVRTADAAELQILRPDDALHAAARRWREPVDPRAIRLRPLPASVPLAAIAGLDGHLTLGVGGPSAEPVRIAPFAAGGLRLLVAGPAGSGRSTTLCTLLAQASRIGVPALVVAPPTSPLVEAARRHGVTVVTVGSDLPRPAGRCLLLVDDAETFTDTPAEGALAIWLAAPDTAAAVAVRNDDPVAGYRGLAGLVRRHGHGVLLDPGALDGELLGVRLPAAPKHRHGQGRGVLVYRDRCEPIQVARPC